MIIKHCKASEVITSPKHIQQSLELALTERRILRYDLEHHRNSSLQARTLQKS